MFNYQGAVVGGGQGWLPQDPRRDPRGLAVSSRRCRLSFPVVFPVLLAVVANKPPPEKTTTEGKVTKMVTSSKMAIAA
eukprot:1172498-Rhodomonas_salina.1